jgi:hypothetical protein
VLSIGHQGLNNLSFSLPSLICQLFRPKVDKTSPCFQLKQTFPQKKAKTQQKINGWPQKINSGCLARLPKIALPASKKCPVGFHFF